MSKPTLVPRINYIKQGPNKNLLRKEMEDNSQRLDRSGIDGQCGFRVQPIFKEQGHEDREIIQSPDSAAVIILDNNPRYAKGGGDFSSRISIVAGIQGANLDENKPIDKLTPLDDAAGVYVVQKDDPQDFFRVKLANGKMTGTQLANPVHAGVQMSIDPADRSDKVKSHVTTYGDTIQMISRDGGINLYAGGVSSKLSTGITSDIYNGVNLIYGNKADNSRSSSVYSLQPLVKGHNLEYVLAEIMKNQRKIMSYLMNNVAGTMPTPWQVAYNALNLITQGINQTFTEINASTISEGGINSRWNKTN